MVRPRCEHHRGNACWRIAAARLRRSGGLALSNMQSPRTMLGHQMTDDAPRPTVTGWETEMHSVELENRLHAIWEKQAQLELSLYRANVDWFDAWPVDAPRELRKMAADVLETACELDAASRKGMNQWRRCRTSLPPAKMIAMAPTLATLSGNRRQTIKA